MTLLDKIEFIESYGVESLHENKITFSLEEKIVHNIYSDLMERSGLSDMMDNIDRKIVSDMLDKWVKLADLRLK